VVDNTTYVFFVAFSIAVDLKLKVCLLLCCLLDRGRSQAQGMSSSLLPSRSRSISSSRYVVTRSVAAPFCGCVNVGVWREIIDCVEKTLQTSYRALPFIPVSNPPVRSSPARLARSSHSRNDNTMSRQDSNRNDNTMSRPDSNRNDNRKTTEEKQATVGNSARARKHSK